MMKFLARVLVVLAIAGAAAAEGDEQKTALAIPSVSGLWCGTGLLHEFSLQLAQKYRDVDGVLKRRDRVRQLTGRLEGNQLRTQSTKVGSLVLEMQGDALRIVGGDGPLALARGMVFTRATGSACAG